MSHWLEVKIRNNEWGERPRRRAEVSMRELGGWPTYHCIYLAPGDTVGDVRAMADALCPTLALCTTMEFVQANKTAAISEGKRLVDEWNAGATKRILVAMKRLGWRLVSAECTIEVMLFVAPNGDAEYAAECAAEEAARDGFNRTFISDATKPIGGWERESLLWGDHGCDISVGEALEVYGVEVDDE